MGGGKKNNHTMSEGFHHVVCELVFCILGEAAVPDCLVGNEHCIGEVQGFFMRRGECGEIAAERAGDAGITGLSWPRHNSEEDMLFAV